MIFPTLVKHHSATYDINEVNTWRAPLASNSGLPSITMNIGYNPLDNLPVGIDELIGKQFEEGKLIEMAYAYEKHSPKRVVPQLSGSYEVFLELSITEMNNLFNVLGKAA